MIRNQPFLVFIIVAQEILFRLILSNQPFNFFSPPSLPCFISFRTLPGNMQDLVLVLRHWMTMEIQNSTRLLRLLRIVHMLLAHIFDCFSGRHWAFFASTIHAVFSGHFSSIPSFFNDNLPTSIYLFCSGLSYDNLLHFINEIEFGNHLLRELISFHEFQHVAVHRLLTSVMFSAADILTIALFVKFSRDNTVSDFHHGCETFSPNLSLITEIDSPSSIDSFDHLDHQFVYNESQQHIDDCILADEVSERQPSPALSRSSLSFDSSTWWMGMTLVGMYDSRNN